VSPAERAAARLEWLGIVQTPSHAPCPSPITNYPLQIGWRYGVNEQTDIGAELLMGGGAQLEGKYNLRPSTDPLAVAVQAGAGAAMVLGTNAEIAQVPVRGIASYDLGDATPYLGLGLEVVWLFDYESERELVGLGN
jgi:hypothetical protein